MKCLIGIALRELLQPADVIDVVVREHQIVDLLQPGVGDDRHDPIGVAVAGIPGVDQQRLPRRRHEQRRLPAFGVDDVDVERLGAGLRRWKRARQNEGEDNPKVLRIGPPLRSVYRQALAGDRRRRDSTLVFERASL